MCVKALNCGALRRRLGRGVLADVVPEHDVLRGVDAGADLGHDAAFVVDPHGQFHGLFRVHAEVRAQDRFEVDLLCRRRLLSMKRDPEDLTPGSLRMI